MRPDKQNINFVNKEVVNYSAIANKAKSLSDGIRSIDFDRINDSITFNSSLVHNRPKIHIKPSNNSINNVSEINFNDNSTLTGITSDSSNTDPTKAISSAIMIDVNNRIEKLETKTQNQTATANETTFTGNVTADTFNGFHLGMNDRFYNIPAIPVVNNDLVMEVGRYIDFHYNKSTTTDYKSRLSISGRGNFHIDHSVLLDNGSDVRARNLISDKGDLNNIVDRTVALETKNTEQDTRLDALETKTQNQSASENETIFNGNITVNTINGYSINETLENITNAAIPVIRADGVFEVRKYLDFHYLDYSSYCRLTYSDNKLQCNRTFKAPNIISDKGDINNIVDRTVALETKNTEQDTRLDALESKDIAQDERLGSIEAMDTAQNETINNINTKNTEQDTRLDNIETKNTEQDTRLTNIESKNNEQDEKIDSLDKTKLSITSKENKNATFNVVHTDEDVYLTIHHFQITVTFEDTEYEPKFTTEEKKLLQFNVNYIYEDTPDTTYYNVLEIYTKMIDGELKTRSIFCDIDSFEVLKGSIIINVHANKRSSKATSIYAYEYYPDALIAPVFIDEHIITKNLTLDNETRLTAATNKNNEQDTRISNLESKISNLLNSIYPVGSIYLSLTRSPPSLGGTWEILTDGYFLQSTTTTTSGETGGSLHHTHKTSGHVLTVGEMPMHKHTFNGNEISGTVSDMMIYDGKGMKKELPTGCFSWEKYGSQTWQGQSSNNAGLKISFNAIPTGSISYEGNNQPHTHGDTEAEYHIPPYITCYMYKRVA